MCVNDKYKKMKIIATINQQEEHFLKYIDFALYLVCIYLGLFLELTNIISNFLEVKEIIIAVTLVFYTYFIPYTLFIAFLFVIRFSRIKFNEYAHLLKDDIELNIKEEDINKEIIRLNFFNKNIWRKSLLSLKWIMIISTIVLLHMCSNIFYLIALTYK